VKRDEASWELTKRLYEEGFSLRQVSAMTHVSPTAIRTRLRKQGVKLRPPGAHHEKEQRLAHEELRLTAFMYVEQEMSSTEISKALGICNSTVMWRLRRAGVEIRSNSEQQKLAWKKRRKLLWAY
jgi:DNA-directed RNA polymerase specialized sigma24 family protein